MSDFLADVERVLPRAVDASGDPPTITPESTRAVADVLRLAHNRGTALQVPGGDPHEGRPVLRLDRLDATLSVDEISRILHVQAGSIIGDVEQRVREYGWTLRLPEAVWGKQVGDWLALGAPGRADKRSDPVLQNVAGIDLVLPSGAQLTIRPAPRRAVGPDLIHAVIGARGRLGVIVAAHLVAQAQVPETLLAFSFPDASTANRALAWIRGHGVRPLRSATHGDQLLVTLEADRPRSAAIAEVTRRVAAEHAGVELPSPAKIPWPQETLPASSEVMDLLQSELDPKGILQP